MKTFKMLDEIGKKAPQPLTEEIKESLVQIKQLANASFSQQSNFGNAALNRRMLLNSQIAALLTPKVLAYLFTHAPTEETKIVRDSSGLIALRDAIYYGFMDGLHVIKLMPNNETPYGVANYTQQKNDYTANTLLIAENIRKAAGLESEDCEIEQQFDSNTLLQQFNEIVKQVKLIKKIDLSANLISVPGYGPENMRMQACAGFESLCKAINVTPEFVREQSDGSRIYTVKDETLESICNTFIENPEALFDGFVLHFFYDRAHLEAALEQDSVIKIGGTDYRYEDIFRTMIQKIVANAAKYPEATEQFALRLSLVEHDLTTRFPCVAKMKEEQIEIAARFKDLLDVLLEKKAKFERDKEPQATINAAIDLHTALKNASAEYFSGEATQENYDRFKQACDDAITPAREALQHHRGWKDFFAKLALTVVSAGLLFIGFSVASKITTRSFRFRLFETDSTKKIDEISKCLGQLSP